MADSDENKQKSTAFGKFATSVEQLFKLATALVAVIYLFGLVVLSVHLGRFGYHSLGLLQLEYIAAGVWAFVPIVMMALLVFIYFYTRVSPLIFEENNNAEQKPPNKPVDWSDKAASMIAIFILWGLIIYAFFWLMSIDFTWGWIASAIFGFLIIYGLSYLPFLIADKSLETKNRLLAGVMLIWCIIGLPFYLISFGRFVYQTIPDVWGGGKAAEVILIAKDDDSKAIIEALGIEFTDSKKSMPVRLVWSTEKVSVIIHVQEEGQQVKGIKLNNDLVSAVLYTK